MLFSQVECKRIDCVINLVCFLRNSSSWPELSSSSSADIRRCSSI